MPYIPGPFPGMHLYLQWGGKLPGNEQWSCGLRMASTGAVTSLDPTSMIAAATTAVQTYHTSVLTSISSRALLQFVKLNAIGTDGHYVESSTTEQIVADVGGGGSGASTMPNQIALAVSLTTAVSRGPAHRGRFYLPLPTFGLDANGVFAAANADAVSDATDTFISSLNAINASWKVAVISRKLGGPMQRLVTGNKVGRVYDTQRRRRRSLIEDYQ